MFVATGAAGRGPRCRCASGPHAQAVRCGPVLTPPCPRPVARVASEHYAFVATGAAGRGPRCRCASDAHWQEPTALRFSLRLARDQSHALHPNITRSLGKWEKLDLRPRISGLGSRISDLGPRDPHVGPRTSGLDSHVELGEFFVQALAGDAESCGGPGLVAAVITEGFGDEPALHLIHLFFEGARLGCNARDGAFNFT